MADTFLHEERLNPLNDFAFQKAMGEKGDEPQLIAFLNTVLERTGKGNIASVDILENKDLPAFIVGGKASKLDVLARLENGTKINIEVQIKNQYNIEKRSLYYWALKFSRDFKEGQDYADLASVICINVLDFAYFKRIDDFHTSFHLYEDASIGAGTKAVKLTDACEIHFLEMPKFRQILGGVAFSLTNPLHRWLAYFDKNSPREVVEEVIKMDTAIQQFQAQIDMIQRDPAMLRTYEQYAKAASDWTSGVNSARREGELEGRRKGEAAKQVDIARNLKKMGLSLPQIAEATGLEIMEIQRL